MRVPPHSPDIDEILSTLSPTDMRKILERAGSSTHEGRYLHWDEIRRRRPPEGLTLEQWWLGMKLSRLAQARITPLRDAQGKPFTYTVPEKAEVLLHEITQRAGGSIGASDQVTNPETRNRYLIRNLMEEGITSSLIEGASTTREKAKEMLRSEKPPRDKGEQMVLNNYAAMQYIIDLGKTELTSQEVLSLQEMLTRGTMRDPTAAGRLRRPDEPIDIVDERDGTVVHNPPPAKELPDRLEALCDFANGRTKTGFVHPVVRSILLHFWLAYDHPFKDGNGRSARALFYMSMLQHDYWLCQFISISEVIYRAPVQYGRVFLYAETDGNDLTYFLLHQLGVVKKAIDELYRYLDDKLAQRRTLEARLRVASSLNDRQLDVIAHALRHPNAQYDIRQHQQTNRIVYETARTDLLQLADLGLLTKRKIGRAFRFYPVSDLQDRLERM